MKLMSTYSAEGLWGNIDQLSFNAFYFWMYGHLVWKKRLCGLWRIQFSQNMSHRWSTRPAHNPCRQWFSAWSWKVGTDGRTICVKTVITTGRGRDCVGFMLAPRGSIIQEYTISKKTLTLNSARDMDCAAHLNFCRAKRKRQPKMLLITFVQIVLKRLWTKFHYFI